jgi:hypothetical protein
MVLMRSRRSFTAALVAMLANNLIAAPAPAVSEADQHRIIQAMSEVLRARIDKLPMLIPAGTPLGQITERTVALNRDAIVVEGQRFDGIVVTSPREKASFAWTFVSPANNASWYIVPEKDEMRGFANFLRRTRAQVPLAAAMKPESGPELTFQKLDSPAWSPNERYLLWFRFKDDAPAEFTIRAGFFARPTLNNNALPSLLFPPAAPAKE